MIRSAANRQGIVRKIHSTWRVVTLFSVYISLKSRFLLSSADVIEGVSKKYPLKVFTIYCTTSWNFNAKSQTYCLFTPA